MSRIGNQTINIPAGVTVTITAGGEYGHQEVKVTGIKGELTASMRPEVSVEMKEQILTVSKNNEEKQSRAYHGLYRALINNMVIGVSEGFIKELHLEGIGYRAEMVGAAVQLSVGYSHKILATPPAGVSVEVQDQTEIKITGYDKQKVGEFAAKLRSYRKPEPYKGKGVRYKDEQVRRKSVKNT